MNKRGISLIVLVITIIVMVILASTVLFYITDTMNNSKISAFALDLKNMEDLVGEYYLSNNELPIVDNLSYNKESIVGLVTEGSDFLSEEISENNDDAETFYLIDMTKLSVDSAKKGMKESGDIADSFIVTKDSMNIYYLKGEKVGKKRYFSLTKEILDTVELEHDELGDNSTISINTTTSAINFEKSTNDWTNDLSVEIKSELSTGETFKCILSGTDVTASIKNNVINISEILLANAELNTQFHSAEANKVLKIQKLKGEEILSETNVNLSNLDMLSSNVLSQSNVEYTKSQDYVLAKISGYSDLGGSGLKEISVLYTSKLDSEGNQTPYYDSLPATITKEYIYSAGVRSNGFVIKLPEDIAAYSLVFVDNAGNISDINAFTY